MDYSSMFNMLDSINLPEEEKSQYQLNSYLPQSYSPNFYDYPVNTNFEEEFKGFKTRPVLYNIDGWISPYSSDNWGGTSDILRNTSEYYKNNEVKLDPNKFFSSEINNLRSLASDQQKITKLFEKRLIESLTEKGKIGLTEADVESMSALTAARAAITNITKEQVAIKKNIADIRIKQAQQQNGTARGGSGEVIPGNSTLGSIDIGRSILDNIFDAKSVNQLPPPTNYQQTNPADADKLLDNLLPDFDNSTIIHENDEPQIYAIVDENNPDNSNIEFRAYDKHGNEIPDYPIPNIDIKNVDTAKNIVEDGLMNQYTIKQK